MTLPISSSVPQNIGMNWFWDEKRNKAAVLLASGHSKTETAKIIGVDRTTIYYWLDIEAFSAEVDRLSLMVGVASRAERLRFINRVVRQSLKDDGSVITEKDILDWLKFAQSETTGAKIDLSKLAEMIAGEGEAQDVGVSSAGPSDRLLSQSAEAAEPIETEASVVTATTDDTHSSEYSDGP